jgi:hypothetical protein
VADEFENQPLVEDLPSEEINKSDLRGIPDTSTKISEEGEEEGEEDQTDLEAAFKLHDQICSKMEAVILSLHEIFPLIEKFNKKISDGDNPDYRLDRRLRVSNLIQTIVAAHSHLDKAARSARSISAIQRDDLANNPRPAFE